MAHYTIPSYGQKTSLEQVRESIGQATAEQHRPTGQSITNLTLLQNRKRSSDTSEIGPPTKRYSSLQHQHALTASAITPFDINTSTLTIRQSLSGPNGINSTPGLSQNPLLSLRHPRYDLPSKLVENFESMGIYSIYPWQSACLLGRGLLEGQSNLIYAGPTGGGKSLVADVLLIKRILENPTKKAILVLPYVALVQEKLRWYRSVLAGVSKVVDPTEQMRNRFRQGTSSDCVQVRGLFGGSRSRLTWSSFDIAICTIEKANGLVNAAVEEGQIDALGVVVLDELHMLNDPTRGYVLEMLITKLRVLKNDIQIIGMSATLSNPKVLADWIQAKFYISNYRPIPIEEHLVYANAIYPTATVKDFLRTATHLADRETLGTTGNQATQTRSGVNLIATALSDPAPTQKPDQPCRIIASSSHKEMKNASTYATVALAVETARDGYGALVFCSSRWSTEATAMLIARAMPVENISAEIIAARHDVLASLQALSAGFESAFTNTILQGVGFHHAGLTTEERELVTHAYDSGVLKVMVATCSLAAGINLPARRVILQGARMGRDLVGPAMLRQMRGRAGRKGKDEIGETYLCCEKPDLEAVAALIEAELPPVESCLTTEAHAITRSILEVITIRLANSIDSLCEVLSASLVVRTCEGMEVMTTACNATTALEKMGLIRKGDFQEFHPTRLGSSIVAASLTPEDGVFVHTEMRQALESFVMDGEMHIFYLFTPVQVGSLQNVSWPIFRDQLESLDESGLRTLRLIGVDPSFVNRLVLAGGDIKENTEANQILARKYRRVYAAFQLRDLCNEMPINEVSLKYSVSRGQVQNLAQTCHGFAAGMIKFCERMGWGMLAAVLEHMVDRLRAGAKADLLEMAQVTFVKSRMARVLWENGFKSIRALAAADPNDLVPIMMQMHWKRGGVDGEAQNILKAKLLEKAEVIVASANRFWERQQVVELEE